MLLFFLFFADLLDNFVADLVGLGLADGPHEMVFGFAVGGRRHVHDHGGDRLPIRGEVGDVVEIKDVFSEDFEFF